MLETKWLEINPQKPEPKKIKEVVEVLKKKGIVAFPTETVYGLACLAKNKRVIKRIYSIKKRSPKKELTIQVASRKRVLELIPEISKPAKILLKRFCPGPVTLVLKTKKGSLGVRIPRHKISLAILRKVREPLVVTSANISGKKEPKTAQDVKNFFWGKIELIIEGRKSSLGEPSTVIDLTRDKWQILRPGRIKRKEIKKVLAKA